MIKIVLLGLYLITSTVTHSQSCDEQNIKLQVLGSGGPELTDGRVSSSHLIWVDGKATVLIDTGGGSAQQFEQAGGKIKDLQAILLTHLHVDHSVDLPTYVKGSFFTDRSQNLWVMGPKGNELMPDTSAYLNDLFGPGNVYGYLSNYWLSETTSTYKIKAIDAPLGHHKIQQHPINEHITASSIGVHHGPISAVAWRVDIGSCAITFSGDMSNQYTSLEKLAAGSDLLVANNAIEESATGVARKLHMPPSEIAEIASKAQVKKLLLAHFMNRSLPHQKQTVKAIKKSYKGRVVLAEDLMVVD